MRFYLIIISLLIPFSVMAIGKTAQEVGETVGRKIEDIISNAQKLSQNTPVRQAIIDFGFSLDNFSKNMIDRVRKTGALDNPMKYFFDFEEGTVFIHSRLFDYTDVFINRASSSEPIDFLGVLLRERMDLDKEDHVRDFWMAIKQFNSETGIGTVPKLTKIFGEQKAMDLLAACIRHDVVREGDKFFLEVIKGDHVRIFASDYFRISSDMSIPYKESIIKSTLGDMPHMSQSTLSFPFMKLWAQVGEMGDEKSVSDFKNILYGMIRSKLDATTTVSTESIGIVFERSEPLKEVVSYARDSTEIADMLTEIIADIL